MAKIGLIGYSGGAIATEWAAELAPAYAPDVSGRLVGAAMGGVPVDPARSLRYIDGSRVWAGMIPMALVGIGRAYHVDLTAHLSAYGQRLCRELQRASIVNVLGAYPGLTWAQLAAPQYETARSMPAYAETASQLIMGSRGTPTVPLFIAQGANGELEGTSGERPGIGAGDGVTITGDVRGLAREYRARGVPVEYVQYDRLSHTTSAVPWLARATAWLFARFAGSPLPRDRWHAGKSDAGSH